MLTIRMLLAVLVISLTASCACKQAVLPDPRIPHRVAEEAEVKALVRHPDGHVTKSCVHLRPGDWIFSAEALAGVR